MRYKFQNINRFLYLARNLYENGDIDRATGATLRRKINK